MERFIAYCQEKAEAAGREAAELEAEERRDESNLAKVKGNVYELCRTICSVNMKLTDGEATKDRCLAKWEELRTAWDASHDLAQTHGDVKKTVIEEVKLQTLAEVEAKFLEKWRA